MELAAQEALAFLLRVAAECVVLTVLLAFAAATLTLRADPERWGAKELLLAVHAVGLAFLAGTTHPGSPLGIALLAAAAWVLCKLARRTGSDTGSTDEG